MDRRRVPKGTRLSTSAWRCPDCRETLGHITRSGELIVTSPGAMVERTRTATMIHCRCGRALAFNGKRVVFNTRVLSMDSRT